MQNMKGAMDHLMKDQTYPATKDEMVKTCNGLSDFSDADRKEFMEKLPEGTYNSAEDVKKALGWQM